MGEEARRALQLVLRPDKESVGGSVSREGDQLIVVAPPGIHRGIPTFLESLTQQPAASQAGSAEVDYWLVAGRPANDAANLGVVPTLRESFEAIVAQDGPMQFRVLEHLKLRSVMGDSGRAFGNDYIVSQKVALAGDELVLDANISRESLNHRLDSRFRLSPGQIAVVSQTGYEKRGSRGEEAPPESLFYIVRANVVN